MNLIYIGSGYCTDRNTLPSIIVADAVVHCCGMGEIKLQVPDYQRDFQRTARDCSSRSIRSSSEMLCQKQMLSQLDRKWQNAPP